MKYDLIIFDWAGTTIDFGCMAPVNAFKEAFHEARLFPSLEEIREPMGLLKIDHVRKMLEGKRLSECFQLEYGRTFHEEDIKNIYLSSEKNILQSVQKYTDPKEHVLETIKILRDFGIKIGSTTGYTKEMMAIVAKAAKEKGYEADTLFTAEDVGGFGRPYPYMIFENMKAHKIKETSKVLKVGDTISDIIEGKNAGVDTCGILIGSSLMGLSLEEYHTLSEVEKEKLHQKLRKQYLEAGATYVIHDLSELPKILKIS